MIRLDCVLSFSCVKTKVVSLFRGASVPCVVTLGLGATLRFTRANRDVIWTGVCSAWVGCVSLLHRILERRSSWEATMTLSSGAGESSLLISLCMLLWTLSVYDDLDGDYPW
jgi:hypothetical protein